jgi:carbon storage regulator CsrA
MPANLILSRRVMEQVRLTMPDGHVIRVTVLVAERNKARLAFTADRDVKIDREEIALRIDAEKVHAPRDGGAAEDRSPAIEGA